MAIPKHFWTGESPLQSQSFVAKTSSMALSAAFSRRDSRAVNARRLAWRGWRRDHSMARTIQSHAAARERHKFSVRTAQREAILVFASARGKAPAPGCGFRPREGFDGLLVPGIGRAVHFRSAAPSARGANGRSEHISALDAARSTREPRFRPDRDRSSVRQSTRAAILPTPHGSSARPGDSNPRPERRALVWKPGPHEFRGEFLSSELE